jgi:hypothetical protein
MSVKKNNTKLRCSKIKKCDVRLRNIGGKGSVPEMVKQIKNNKKIVWEVNKNFTKMPPDRSSSLWMDPSSDESDDDMVVVNGFDYAHRGEVKGMRGLQTEDDISDKNDNILPAVGKLVVPFDQIETLLANEIDNSTDSDLSIHIDRISESPPRYQSLTTKRVSAAPEPEIRLSSTRSMSKTIESEEYDRYEEDPSLFLQTEIDSEEDLGEVTIPDLKVPEDGDEEEEVTEELLDILRDRVYDVDWVENEEGDWVVKGDNKHDIKLKKDGGYVEVKDEHGLFEGNPVKVKMRNIRKVFGLLGKPVLLSAHDSIIVENRWYAN